MVTVWPEQFNRCLLQSYKRCLKNIFLTASYCSLKCKDLQVATVTAEEMPCKFVDNLNISVSLRKVQIDDILVYILLMGRWGIFSRSRFLRNFKPFWQSLPNARGDFILVSSREESFDRIETYKYFRSGIDMCADENLNGRWTVPIRLVMSFRKSTLTLKKHRRISFAILYFRDERVCNGTLLVLPIFWDVMNIGFCGTYFNSYVLGSMILTQNLKLLKKS